VGWAIVGFPILFGDYVLSDYEPSAPTLVATLLWMPVIASAIATRGVMAYYDSQRIIGRRCIAGAGVCLVIWAICVAVVSLT
jgi:hypothetical protein